MMVNRDQLEQERKSEHEFVTKLGRLVLDYRTEVPMGHLIGALEIVKMRINYEGTQNLMREMKREKHEEDTPE